MGGYTAFAVEITGRVRIGAGSTNVVAVKVDNRHDSNVPPLSADYTFYGGIYRDVWLLATEKVRVTTGDYASSGVYVDTPSVSGSSATVRVRGSVYNGTAVLKQIRVRNTILDHAGIAVATVDSTFGVGAGRKAPFEASKAVANPRLWSPKSPYLYTVRTEVYESGLLVDRVENPLGIRSFSFTKDGFYLNGERLQLRGTNRHQDYKKPDGDRKELGNAMPNHLHEEDMRIIKGMGANFVRLAHYPQDPAVLDAADRLGLLVWEEIPIVDYVTPSPEFAQNCRTMLTEMIRQHYNHPSVVTWGYMNEVLFRGPAKTEAYKLWVADLARDLDALAHTEDRTRATVMACNQNEVYNTSGLADVPDVVGWNVYQGWYGGQLSGLGGYPGRPTLPVPGQADLGGRVRCGRRPAPPLLEPPEPGLHHRVPARLPRELPLSDKRAALSRRERHLDPVRFRVGGTRPHDPALQPEGHELRGSRPQGRLLLL